MSAVPEIVTAIDHWRDLSKYISAHRPGVRPESNYTPVHVRIRCAICKTSHLDLPPWVTSDHGPRAAGAASPHPTEPPCVVPGCAHLVGWGCMEERLGRDGGRQACPVCGRALRYACGHAIPVGPVPRLAADRRVQDVVPGTRAWVLDEDTGEIVEAEGEGGEDGGREESHVRGQCRACRRESLRRKAAELLDIGFGKRSCDTPGSQRTSPADYREELCTRMLDEILGKMDAYQESLVLW
ncbi:uncharacterized protein JN550_003932 [Neoarthrinium moseri]|uniref:uncharacterized protein n=1 Tax=Neoarthrinium moseri TaxID=1658444 RepID=UPI001FDBB645|nr:uncharacterized protein JN550_003932 [Neoarthrinium moseri]KAI1872213.1 hypothetical protein JN550_003932 [Neoarthrinium moseri]